MNNLVEEEEEQGAAGAEEKMDTDGEKGDSDKESNKSDSDNGTILSYFLNMIYIIICIIYQWNHKKNKTIENTQSFTRSFGLLSFFVDAFHNCDILLC